LHNYDDVPGRLTPQFRVFLPAFGNGCPRARWQKTESFFAVPAHRTEGLERLLEWGEDSVDTCVALRTCEGQAAVREVRTIAGGGGPPGPESAAAPGGDNGR